MESTTGADRRGLLGSAQEVIRKALAGLCACIDKICDFDNRTGFATDNCRIGDCAVWLCDLVGFCVASLGSVVCEARVATPERAANKQRK